MIVRYGDNGEHGFVAGWYVHQHIQRDKRYPSALPPPPVEVNSWEVADQVKRAYGDYMARDPRAVSWRDALRWHKQRSAAGDRPLTVSEPSDDVPLPRTELNQNGTLSSAAEPPPGGAQTDETPHDEERASTAPRVTFVVAGPVQRLGRPDPPSPPTGISPALLQEAHIRLIPSLKVCLGDTKRWQNSMQHEKDWISALAHEVQLKKATLDELQAWLVDIELRPSGPLATSPDKWLAIMYAKRNEGRRYAGVRGGAVVRGGEDDDTLPAARETVQCGRPDTSRLAGLYDDPEPTDVDAGDLRPEVVSHG